MLVVYVHIFSFAPVLVSRISLLVVFRISLCCSQHGCLNWNRAPRSVSYHLASVLRGPDPNRRASQQAKFSIQTHWQLSFHPTLIRLPVMRVLHSASWDRLNGEL